VLTGAPLIVVCLADSQLVKSTAELVSMTPGTERDEAVDVAALLWMLLSSSP